jgi:hypothetical protein
MPPEPLKDALIGLLDGDGHRPVLLDGDGGLAAFWLRDEMPDADEQRLAAAWHAVLSPRLLILA